MKKKIALLMTAVMLFGATVAGTLAWLQASTGEVVNTFTYGDISIVLKEADVNIETNGKIEYAEYVKNNEKVDSIAVADRVLTNSYKIIPGSTYSKDPRIDITAGSESCYLFVKVEKLNDYDTYMKDYTMADGWVEMDTGTGVYYKENPYSVETLADGEQVYVLKGTTYANGEVEVKDTVTKQDLEILKSKAATDLPQLKFTAYAVQSANMASAEAAWNATFGATN